LAKTAMRAMGRYVPIDLVRLLYRTGQEPVLGGEVVDVTLLFTDIKDFTTLGEQLAPNELARVLGQYLEVMTGAIHSTQGTIDKYIADALPGPPPARLRGRAGLRRGGAAPVRVTGMGGPAPVAHAVRHPSRPRD